MVLHIIKRIVLILAGYALAALMSGVAVAVTYKYAERETTDLVGLVVLVVMLIAIYAAAPALLAVLVGETVNIRKPLYYIAVACVIGMVLPVLMAMKLWYIGLGLALGIPAGLIYWVLAGRRAGFKAVPVA